jgi:hypothetical protein
MVLLGMTSVARAGEDLERTYSVSLGDAIAWSGTQYLAALVAHGDRYEGGKLPKVVFYDRKTTRIVVSVYGSLKRSWGSPGETDEVYAKRILDLVLKKDVDRMRDYLARAYGTQLADEDLVLAFVAGGEEVLRWEIGSSTEE